MMKVFIGLCFFSGFQFSVNECDAAPFQREYIWGSREYGNVFNEEKVVVNVKSGTTSNEIVDDYEQAEDAVFHAVERVERGILKAVEDEVDILFHKTIEPKSSFASNKKLNVLDVSNENHQKKSSLHGIHPKDILDVEHYIKAFPSGFI